MSSREIRPQPARPAVDKVDPVEKVDRVDQIDKVKKVDQIDKVDKNGKIDRVDRGGKIDKVDQEDDGASTSPVRPMLPAAPLRWPSRSDPTPKYPPRYR